MQPVDISKTRGRLLKPPRLSIVDPWLPCRILLYSYRRKKAVAVLRLWFDPGAGARRVLLLRDGGGNVFQAAGTVARSAAGEGYYSVEVRIPWSAALPLAAWAKKAVREGGTTVLHSYVARIKGMALPPLKLTYEGYLALYGTLIRKVLDAPVGVYFLEIRLGGASLLVPAKYYRHERQDRKGGDAGTFQLPIDVFRTLVEWGLHEPGSDYDHVYVKIWRPEPPEPQLGKAVEASAL
jgi:hypothetical protein